MNKTTYLALLYQKAYIIKIIEIIIGVNTSNLTIISTLNIQ
jgi:hypothetical protein